MINPVMVRPVDLKPGDELGFKIVACVGWSGKDWAAYRGLLDWTDREVADSGDKLSKEVAEALFYAPVAAGMIYRT